jgi:hypothetical protein
MIAAGRKQQWMLAVTTADRPSGDPGQRKGR